MAVYVLNIIFIITIGVFLIYLKPTIFNRKIFVIMSASSWVLISGLRHWSIGADTYGYFHSFQRARQITWKESLKILKDVYVLNEAAPTLSLRGVYKDPGYLIFEKIIGLFTGNYQIYLLIVAMIIFSSLALFVYRNSSDPLLSFIIFSTLFYSFYAITGIRQSLATSLIVFLGYENIKNKNLIAFFLLTIISFTLHKSVLVFAPFYFFAHINVDRKYILTMIGILLALFAGGPSLILNIASWFGYVREEVYRGNTYNYVIMMLLIGFSIVTFYRKLIDKEPTRKYELNATILGVFLTLLTLIDQSLMRVQQYYSLFILISIPTMTDLFKKNSKYIIKGVLIILLVLFFLSNAPNYMFFWEY